MARDQCLRLAQRIFTKTTPRFAEWKQLYKKKKEKKIDVIIEFRFDFVNEVECAKFSRRLTVPPRRTRFYAEENK